MSAFKVQLPKIVDNDAHPLIHPDFVKDSSISDAVFFNHNHTRCLLLLLLKLQDDSNLDWVIAIQGTLTNEGWIFKSDRLPSIPEMIFSIKKEKLNGHFVSNSFLTLSDNGIDWVLSENQRSKNCYDIDDKYWFGDNK